MLTRALRRAAPLLAVLVLAAAPLAAQQRRSPSDDVLEAAKRALNDLRYDEAIRLGRDLEAFAGQLRQAQLVTLRQLLALAYYPEEPERQRPDSALRQLVALVKVRPDAELAPDLRWRGLDSLLDVARARTFAVGLVPLEEVALTAEGGPIEVAATRPARVRLSLVERASGRVVVADTALVNGRGTLRLRAHDGQVALVRAGAHQLRLVAHEVGARDSVHAEREVVVTAPGVTLQPVPVLDPARLRPETEKPDRASTAVKGLLFGVATAAIGSVARGGGRLARDFDPDPRAAGVGGLITLGSFALALTEKGRPIPANVRANAQVRATHARAVQAARDENARRLSGYKAVLRLAPEDQ